VRLPNQAPSIAITSGPVDDSLHSYRVTFYWAAHDSDGRVVGYEYAVDDTTTQDSLHATTETRASFLLPVAPPPRRAHPPGGVAPSPLDTLSAMHSFHVRAQDDGGQWSTFASASFEGFTLSPTSRIISPDARPVAVVGSSFVIEWEGLDLDGTSPPTRFSTRIVSVPPDSTDPIDVTRLDRPGGGPPWTAFIAGTVAPFEGVELGSYLFGVRALDEAGAVEAELRLEENVLGLTVVKNPGLPSLTVTAGGRSVDLPAIKEEDKTFPMVSGQTLIFNWSASAAAYGAHIVGHAYGVDLTSVDPHHPGWIPVSGPPISLRFINPPGIEEGLHILHFRITDSIGQSLIADVILPVGPEDFSRDILYVDDIGNDVSGGSTLPTDADHDRFVREVLLAEAVRQGMQIDELEVQAPSGTMIREPDLATLRRYRLLVWTLRRSGAVLQTSMEPGSDQAVARYLELGGNLWAIGNSVLNNMTLPPTPNPFGFLPGDLGYDALHIETERQGAQIVAGGIRRGGASIPDRRINGLVGAIPTPEAREESWPVLSAVHAPYADGSQGMPACEGMTIGYEQRGRPGDLDTLYTYVANGQRLMPPTPSLFDDAPCAFRYTRPGEGRILVTCFPMDWWSDGAADSLGRSALDWLVDEDPQPRGRRAPAGRSLSP
jgi:hypothetical protein